MKENMMSSGRPKRMARKTPIPCGRADIGSRMRRDGGTVLIVTMWVILVLVGLVLVFGRSMRVEALVSANYLASFQADAVARGALQFVLAQVDGLEGAALSDTETVYEAVEVGNGIFWVLSPDIEDDHEYRFGITDESAKINLNSATRDMLLKLPGMTEELAAAIIDWRDSDSETTPGGAENEHYLLLSNPYYCKNAPFESVEELLLVNGASYQLLYGEDTNRNGVLDPNESDGADSGPADNRDSTLDRGFFPYVTVYSIEPNQTGSGESRANVNQTGGSGELSKVLRDVLSDDRYYQIMPAVRSGRPYSNVFEFYFRSGLTMAEFRQIADKLTTSNEENLLGLVNVNTAPSEVLLCLPGLDESDVDALLARRASPDTDLDSIAWVAEALPQEKAVAIGHYITCRTFQYSADIVAVSGGGRAFKRYVAVLDTRSSPPRLRYWKDLTYLGWPLDPEIISVLRSGTPGSEMKLSLGMGK